jgi:hypothetical protein
MPDTPKAVAEQKFAHHTLSALYRYFGVLRGFKPVQAFDYNRSCRWMQSVKVEALSARLCEPMVPRGGEVMPCPILWMTEAELMKRG